MSRLQQLSIQVDQVFAELGERYARYQRDRALFCRPSCGECCLHPEVEATVLEMLPLAFELLAAGKAEEMLATLGEHSHSSCLFYVSHSPDRTQGQCSVYQQRPGVCRMFGAAGYNGREGEVLLSVCKNIRADHPKALQETLIALESDPPPMIRNGKEQLRQLDYELGGINYPINQAVRLALEKVLFEQYYASFAG